MEKKKPWTANKGTVGEKQKQNKTKRFWKAWDKTFNPLGLWLETWSTTLQSLLTSWGSILKHLHDPGQPQCKKTMDPLSKVKRKPGWIRSTECTPKNTAPWLLLHEPLYLETNAVTPSKAEPGKRSARQFKGTGQHLLRWSEKSEVP